jgi:DNA polymerase-3 subunit gamma/tau
VDLGAGVWLVRVAALSAGNGPALLLYNRLGFSSPLDQLMSYQVLARKWRPRKFAEMVGQEHVLRALVNALDNDRLHHAYLFTGTRGVGKTTVARIFAKSLNCERGVSAEPCGQCSSCTEIDEGRFVDLIEVDAASRTKVEDTRELLENVQYAPTRGRYKVYLVDEVHMLSTHSFNALLKTLEEPPPHVKFLLATTDPQKLPATVLSRCLQFNLKRLPLPMIAGHLEHLLQAEGVEYQTGALRLLARAADGSMRDALSLLDQAIAYVGGRVLETEVRAMLGTIEQGYVVELLRALAAADGAALLEAVERLSQHTPDYEGVLAEVLTYLQQIAIAQVVPAALDEHLEEREAVRELAQRMLVEDVQLYYQIGLIGRRDLQLAPDLRGGLEMVLLRMLAFRPASGEEQSVSATGAPTGRDAKSPARDVKTAAPPPTPMGGEPEADGNWPALIESMNLKGVLRELAMNCAVGRKDGDRWYLLLDPSHQQLLSRERRQRLEQQLRQRLQREIRLEIEMAGGSDATPAQQARQEAELRQTAAIHAIESDPNIKAIQQAFDATLHPESIRPVDSQ